MSQTPLTEVKIKSLRPREKAYKVFDSGGLYLEVTPTGSKRWRFKYRFQRKEKLISLGLYPDVSLKDARLKRDESRITLASGIDPSALRQEKASALLHTDEHTLFKVASRWLEKMRHEWGPTNYKTVSLRLNRNVFPTLGSLPISTITSPMLLELLTKIESRGTIETAHRVKGNIDQIMRYAIVCGMINDNPAIHLKGALITSKPKHLAAATSPSDFAEVLKSLYAYKGSVIVETALKLAPHVFVRPGELRIAKWKDIDLEAKIWAYDVGKTKTKHIVPLSRQSIEILTNVHTFTASCEYVFPCTRSHLKPMSNNAILAAMRRMAIAKDEMSAHGFRAVARTLLNEVLKYPAHLIEHQLAHVVRDPLGRAYNRTQHLDERREMMAKWSDYIDSLLASNNDSAVDLTASLSSFSNHLEGFRDGAGRLN